MMYLQSLNIQGYKNFKEPFDIKFSKGLNILVGENGTGKSAIIDAIRLLLLEDEFGRNLVDDSDFHAPFDKPKTPAEFFQIYGQFSDLSREEIVAFLPWLAENNQATLTLHVQNKPTSKGRFKWELWGGVSRSSMFERELFETIHCVYLPPLRDAEAKLREGKGSRLARLLRKLNKKILDQEDDHPLGEEVKEFNKKLTEQDSIKKANMLIRTRLEEAMGGVFGQDVSIQYSETNFVRIVENLRLLFYPDLISTPEPDMFRSLDQNSLGYNNLLYLATVLAELTEDTTEDPKYLRLLLIEEPEAHLHPQLQVKLLKYLETKAEKENVQIIVSTHSPVVASSVPIRNLIHLSASPVRSPKTVPIIDCRLEEDSANFLSRWLDVTKSVLLFARGVILVEGIAEAILLPELAKRVLHEHNKKPEQKNLLPSLLEEAGVSVINMNGIYFNHFMQLFCDINGINHESKIPVFCAGITDNDPPEGKEVVLSNPVEGKNPALGLVQNINNSKWARLYSAKFKTFEFDLALEEENAKEMLKVLIELWPSEGNVKKGLACLLRIEQQNEQSYKPKVALKLLKRIEDKKIGKGYFAQSLAGHLSKSNASFAVPEYIRKAVIWACGGGPDAT
jgi:putative ATP-dependent endonuclease of OLD family